MSLVIFYLKKWGRLFAKEIWTLRQLSPDEIDALQIRRKNKENDYGSRRPASLRENLVKNNRAR